MRAVRDFRRRLLADLLRFDRRDSTGGGGERHEGASY